LDEKLDSIELRQLKQRIALRSQLQPLNLDETRGYIQRRLQLAGANSNSSVIFPAETIAHVYRHSRGIPRLINTVCENALITGYARQSRSVTPDIIEDIATDFRLGVVHQPKVDSSNGNEEGDARRAAKTLLLLHDYLQKLQSSQGEPRVAAATGATKHEPYI
jgi:general secretion pathway protein A